MSLVPGRAMWARLQRAALQARKTKKRGQCSPRVSSAARKAEALENLRKEDREVVAGAKAEPLIDVQQEEQPLAADAKAISALALSSQATSLASSPAGLNGSMVASESTAMSHVGASEGFSREPSLAPLVASERADSNPEVDDAWMHLVHDRLVQLEEELAAIQEERRIEVETTLPRYAVKIKALQRRVAEEQELRRQAEVRALEAESKLRAVQLLISNNAPMGAAARGVSVGSSRSRQPSIGSEARSIHIGGGQLSRKESLCGDAPSLRGGRLRSSESLCSESPSVGGGRLLSRESLCSVASSMEVRTEPMKAPKAVPVASISLDAKDWRNLSPLSERREGFYLASPPDPSHSLAAFAGFSSAKQPR